MIARLWCRLFHPRVSHPINGAYRCWTCFRVYPVQWGPETHAKPDARVGVPVEVRL